MEKRDRGFKARKRNLLRRMEEHDGQSRGGQSGADEVHRLTRRRYTQIGAQENAGQKTTQWWATVYGGYGREIVRTGVKLRNECIELERPHFETINSKYMRAACRFWISSQTE